MITKPQNPAQEFKDLARKYIELPIEEKHTVEEQLYCMAEEVVMSNGGEYYSEVVDKLREVVKSNEAFQLDIENGIDEHNAWKHLTELCIESEIINTLSEEQKVKYLELAGTYDNYVESFLHQEAEKGQVSVEMVEQLYLAQTIGFHYKFGEVDYTPDGVVAVLLEQAGPNTNLN